MPYIPQEERKELDELSKALVTQLRNGNFRGRLNYFISSVAQGLIEANGTSYSFINDFIGVLECAKLELYRRVATPYEEKKKEENGDVYLKECPINKKHEKIIQGDEVWKNPHREKILMDFHKTLENSMDFGKFNVIREWQQNWNDKGYRNAYYNYLIKYNDGVGHMSITIPPKSQEIIKELIKIIFDDKITGKNPNKIIAYDIGSALGSWSKIKSSPLYEFNNIESVLFEANTDLEEIYNELGWKHYIGLLGEEEGKQVEYHYNYENLGGNSRYLENNAIFKKNSKKKTMSIKTLDRVVKENKLPLPDIMKIDVQGSELDVMRGAKNCLKNTKVLIIEAQHTNWNDGAPQVQEVLDYAISEGFELWEGKISETPVDADYFLVKKNLMAKKQS